MLLESSPRFDFLLSKNCISAGDSLGDSYTFGIAGTGGTSSSSSFEAGILFIDLGAGRREPLFWGKRGCSDPVDVLTVLLLASDPTENPELYDFLLGSGVVLWDDGVEVLRGSIEGDREAGRSGAAGGGGCKAIELFNDS